MEMVFAKMKNPPKGVGVAFGRYSKDSGQAYVELWNIDGTVRGENMSVSESSDDWEFLALNDENLNKLQDEFDTKKANGF